MASHALGRDAALQRSRRRSVPALASRLLRAAARPQVLAVLAVALVFPLTFLPSALASLLAGLLHLASLAAAAACLVAAARRASGRERRAHLFLAGSLTASALGSCVLVGYLLVSGDVPPLSWADPVTLLWMPLAAAGLCLVPTRSSDSFRVRRVLVDGAVASTALLFVAWVVVLEPMVEAGLGSAVQALYPLCDVFVIAMVLSLLPHVRPDLRQRLNRVAVGLVLIVVAHSAMVLFSLGGSVSPFGWPDLLFQGGMAFVLLGTIRPVQSRLDAPSSASRLDPALVLLPVLAAACAAVWDVTTEGALHPADVSLMMLVVGLVLFRQLLYSQDLSRAALESQYAASHDALTGLLNRKAFLGVLSDCTAVAEPQAAVVLLDLDGFKEVNDSFGHDAGDHLLEHFAAALERAASAASVARLGGDEFALLLVSPDAEAAALGLVESFAAGLAGPGSVSFSAGVASLRPGDTPAAAMARADAAMYCAKRDPSVHVLVFVDEMGAAAERRQLLLSALPGAAARGEMRLVFQPMFSASSGELLAAETLLRWDHPVFGPVSPEEFVPLAEECGGIVILGAWVLEQALAQVSAWSRAGRTLPRVFVNVAASQFVDSFPSQVLLALGRHGVEPGVLTLEVTEGQVPGLGANEAMLALRGAGVHVAMDDFGSGYSSLSQLSLLPVDVLKLDRGFVLGLATRTGRPVVEAVVGLARALGLTTVAEGVEDEAQAALVAEVGIDVVQGFFFARPLPPEDVFPLLPVSSLLR